MSILTEEIKRLKSEWQSADNDVNSADESIKSNDLYIEELENKIKTYAEAENLQRTKTIRQNELEQHKWRKYQSLSRIYDNLNRDNLFDRFICEWPVKEALVILFLNYMVIQLNTCLSKNSVYVVLY